MGQTDGGAEKEEVKSTILKPSNGRPIKSRPKGQGKSRSMGFGLRRLSKRQKEKIYRILTLIFLIVFAFTIVGTLIAFTVKVPGQ